MHLKCCGNPGGSEDTSRQRSADAIANWLADARGLDRPSGDNVTLAAGTPMLVLGDFNFVGGPRPELALRTGDILDESVFGPDAAGDWDGSYLLDVAPRDPTTDDDFTWQGNSSFPPSRLDRFYLTDSAATIAAGFILNTDTLAPEALAVAGLEASDTLRSSTSDHLPIVLDLRLWSGRCVGDLNDDGGVGLDDLLILIGDFGNSGPNAPGDLDGDGDTDLADLVILLNRFGATCH